MMIQAEYIDTDSAYRSIDEPYVQVSDGERVSIILWRFCEVSLERAAVRLAYALGADKSEVYSALVAVKARLGMA